MNQNKQETRKGCAFLINILPLPGTTQRFSCLPFPRLLSVLSDTESLTTCYSLNVCIHQSENFY